MSNEKLAAAFAGKKAFIPFVTAGDPTLETTKDIVRAVTVLVVGKTYVALAAMN